MKLSFNTKQDVTAQNLTKLNKLLFKENTVVLNHATWCGHCQMFKPQWDEFKQRVSKKVNVVEVEADALEALKSNQKVYKRIVSKDGMVYFPMIIVFVKKGDTSSSEKKLYEGNRNANDLQSYIESKVKVTKPSAKNIKKTKGNNLAHMDSMKTSKLSLHELHNELDKILKQLNYK